MVLAPVGHTSFDTICLIEGKSVGAGGDTKDHIGNLNLGFS